MLRVLIIFLHLLLLITIIIINKRLGGNFEGDRYVYSIDFGDSFVRGVCNFLSSVLLQQKFEATDGPVLQLSFIWQAKENTSLRCEGRPTQKM